MKVQQFSCLAQSIPRELLSEKPAIKHPEEAWPCAPPRTAIQNVPLFLQWGMAGRV